MIQWKNCSTKQKQAIDNAVRAASNRLKKLGNSIQQYDIVWASQKLVGELRAVQPNEVPGDQASVDQRLALHFRVGRGLRDMLERIQDGLIAVCDCDCAPRKLAYTYTSESFTIYFCPLFFNPQTSDEKRSGTIVHEVSHLKLSTNDDQDDLSNWKNVQELMADAYWWQRFGEDDASVEIAMRFFWRMLVRGRPGP